jgi:serine/threonine-protein kinase
LEGCIDNGTRIAGRYTVLGHVGTGGMGEVFEIRDALGNRLALKLMHPELLKYPKVVRRFEREGRLQASLTHRTITRVFDLLHHDGRPGLVMEYIEAPTMREWLDARRPSVEDVRKLAAELLDGLAVAHEAGVVHRDIKPDNIFILGTGRKLSCKLIDFGIAKSIDAREDKKLATLTLFDEYVGTYRYSSPEQLMRSASVDPRSDLFSLGVLIWEALSGLPPWPAATAPVHVMSAVLEESLPSLPDDVPDDLQRLVAELTRKDREERPQTAAEALDMLRGPPTDLRGATQFDTGEEDAATELMIPVSRITDTAQLGEKPDAPTVSDGTEIVSEAATVVVTPAPKIVSDAATLVVTRTPEPPVPLAAPPRVQFRAQLFDLAVPLLCLMTCIGFPLHPVWMIGRGVQDGRTHGEERAGISVVDATTGRPISGPRILARNALEFFVFHGPFAVAVWPISILGSGGTSLLLLLWCAAVLAIEHRVIQDSDDGRRLLDRATGTRVVLAP